MKYVLTYGVACVEESSGIRELISRVPDVTTDRDRAERIVNMLNEHMIPPEHLNDVVEDLLCEL
jgi:hypothetical protein